MKGDITLSKMDGRAEIILSPGGDILDLQYSGPGVNFFLTLHAIEIRALIKVFRKLLHEIERHERAGEDLAYQNHNKDYRELLNK